MKFKILFIFVMLFAINARASLPSAPESEIIAEKTFNERFLGINISDFSAVNVNLPENGKYLVRTESDYGEIFQPIEVKNGAVYINKAALNLNGEVQVSHEGTSLVSDLFCSKLSAFALLAMSRSTVNLAPFPEYPVLLSFQEDEKLSLENLTALLVILVREIKLVFDKLIQEANFSLEQMRNEEMRKFFSSYLKAFRDIPNQFKHLTVLQVFENSGSEADRGNFTKTKEEFFDTFKIFNKMFRFYTDLEFFAIVAEMGQDFDRTFFSRSGGAPSTRLSPGSDIYKRLSCPNKFVQYTMARALLFSLFVHPEDTIPDLNMANSEDFIYLALNPNQIARITDHIEPIHIIHPGEEVPVQKSYWILGQNKTTIDLLNYMYTIVNPIINNTLQINGVEVSEGVVKIVIKMKDLPKWIIDMYALNKKNGVAKTDCAIIIIKEVGGYFVAATFHPILQEETATPIKIDPKYVIQSLECVYPGTQFKDKGVVTHDGI